MHLSLLAAVVLVLCSGALPLRADSVWEAALPPLPVGQSPAQVPPEHYGPAVEALLRQFEQAVGRRLTPGEKGRVGLKIYTESGPGLATPKPLVEALVQALGRRGYPREHVFLVGLNHLRLRLTGYLPADARTRTPFSDHPFYVLESGRYYDPTWFYDSPLPARFDFIRPLTFEERGENLSLGPTRTTADQHFDADRKSFLATPLFLDADFWINLPVYTDHPALGVNGALVNATLWNASNTARFFRSLRTAPAAVAEMAAIPELRETWAFTLVSLEQWQFVGGPAFNSLYTRSEPRLWLGRDPVRMDSLMQERIDQARRESGFQPLSDELRTLEFAEILGIGRRKGSPPTPVSPAP